MTRPNIFICAALMSAAFYTANVHAEKIGFVSLIEPGLRISSPVQQAGTNIHQHNEKLLPFSGGTMASVVLGPAIDAWKKSKPGDQIETFALTADSGSKTRALNSIETSIASVRGDLDKIVAKEGLDKLVIFIDARFPDPFIIKGSFTGVGLFDGYSSAKQTVIPYVYLQLGVVNAKTMKVIQSKDIRRYERMECPEVGIQPTSALDCLPIDTFTNRLTELVKESITQGVSQIQ